MCPQSFAYTLGKTFKMAVRFGYSPHALKMQALINRMVNPLATATSDLISVESLPQKDGDGVVPAEPRGKSDLGLGHRDTTPSRASQSEQTVVDQGQRAASEDKSKEERVQVKEENSPGKRRRSEDLSPEPADVRDDKRRKVQLRQISENSLCILCHHPKHSLS